jgi:hypothetical protein
MKRPRSTRIISPSEYATYNPHANTIPIPEPDNTRPPSLLQSGKKPTVMKDEYGVRMVSKRYNEKKRKK